jgi:hypothetical protein
MRNLTNHLLHPGTVEQIPFQECRSLKRRVSARARRTIRLPALTCPIMEDHFNQGPPKKCEMMTLMRKPHGLGRHPEPIIQQSKPATIAIVARPTVLQLLRGLSTGFGLKWDLDLPTVGTGSVMSSPHREKSPK